MTEASLSEDSATKLRGVNEIAQELREQGIDVAEIVRGTSYEDCSVLAVVPTRGLIHGKVVHSWLQMARPTNQAYAFYFVYNHEVGVAYNNAIRAFLHDKRFQRFKWMLTMEDDNIIPPMAIHMLVSSALKYGYDVVAGLYHMKGPLQVPMVFGKEGDLDPDGKPCFRPFDVTPWLLNPNAEPIPVNGVACGCTLWNRSVFEDIEDPWFQTWTRLNNQEGMLEVVSQDIDFCKKMRAKNKRIAVDTRVRVGHIDRDTGEIF